MVEEVVACMGIRHCSIRDCILAGTSTKLDMDGMSKYCSIRSLHFYPKKNKNIFTKPRLFISLFILPWCCQCWWG
jgi:hypothetical protein